MRLPYLIILIYSIIKIRYKTLKEFYATIILVGERFQSLDYRKKNHYLEGALT